MVNKYKLGSVEFNYFSQSEYVAFLTSRNHYFCEADLLKMGATPLDEPADSEEIELPESSNIGITKDLSIVSGTGNFKGWIEEVTTTVNMLLKERRST